MKRFKIENLFILFIFTVAFFKLYTVDFNGYLLNSKEKDTTKSMMRKFWVNLKSKRVSSPEENVRVLTFTNNWTETNIFLDYNLKSDIKSILKDDKNNLTIFIHNPKVDGVSRNVALNSEWEPHLDVIIRKYLNTDPGMKFIDIGANIGVKSLKMLSFGRQVISIEPDESNLKLLCKSVAENKFQKNITIIHNIVGDRHFESLKMAVGTNGDRTSNFVLDSKELEFLKKKSDGRNFYKTDTHIVPLMKLDDLLQLPEIRNNKRGTYFLKIDVEGYEDRVIKGGMHFIRHGGVKGILMEWRWHKIRKSADVILRSMIRLGFEPFSETGKALLKHTPRYWSDDVLWLPRKQKLHRFN